MADQHTASHIIHQACKETLLPLGVFQKGASRIYLDDNGWFFTVVEFQPSDWGQGTYLNIGICLLWNQRDYLSFDLHRGTVRQGTFIPFETDSQFRQAVEKCAKRAKKQVLFFRKLRNPKVGKWWLLSRKNLRQSDKRRILMLAGTQSNRAQVIPDIQKTREFWHSQPSMKHMPHWLEFEGGHK